MGGILPGNRNLLKIDVKTNNTSLLWIVLGVLALFIFYIIIFNYFQLIDQEKKRVLDKLKGITCTASLQIDVDAHQRIAAQWKHKDDQIAQSAEYLRLHDELRKIVDVNKLESPIYTLIYDSARHHFEFIATSASSPYFRHPYSNYPPELIDNFDKGGIIDVYQSENGQWLSAFAPIKSKDGKAIAILQADEDFTYFKQKANRQLLRQAGIALMSFAPFGLILFFYLRSFIAQKNKFEQDLLKHEKAIVHQSEIIKAQNERLKLKNKKIKQINSILDARVRARTKSLIEAMRELRTYLYRSSHDIRGPLATLLGLSQLMAIEDSSTPFPKMIKETSSQLDRRIRGLTELYELKFHKGAQEDIDLIEIICNASTYVFGSLCKPFTICLDFDENIQLRSDRSALELAIRESVHNAVTHQVFASSVRIWIRTMQSDCHTIFQIIDNGPGMDDAIRDRACEMFFRGNERSNGAGLGLFKINTIAKKLNGKLDLSRAENGGTQLSLAIPV